MNNKAIEMHMQQILEVIEGTNGTLREGLRETPARVARMYEEIFAGYREDPKEILGKLFKEDIDYTGMVIEGNIPFVSHCEHHMVVFNGFAHIGYVPNQELGVVGLSKLARLVDCFAKRLQVQERLTQQILDAMVTYLKPQGAIVVVEAEHHCMSCRGVKKSGVKTKTSSVYGVFDTDPSARAEFFTLLRGN